MKIEKINDNKIRCTLTSADLAERNLKLSELAYGTEKARSLFQDMMLEANQQFGFNVDNAPLMVEAVPVAPDSIVLIITRVEDPQELDTRFAKFAPSGDDTDGPEPVQYSGADDIIDLFHKLCDVKNKAQEIAKKAAQYIQNIADYSEDGEAALVKYNDTYLTDLYYLGVCQGPIGTSRLFYKLYRITGDESYKDFVIKLTNGLLAAGAPTKHSDGYWRTNCYCCGAAGMLEHFLHVHKLTGNSVYLDAAYEAAEAIIGESTYQHKVRNWYTSWNRHEPDRSEAYVGLYHGSGGCAASLLALAQYIEDKTYLPGYLEDPYQDLYVS